MSGPELHWFRLLLATRLVGQFADGAFQVALASYVVFEPQKAATPAAVAQAFAVLLLPFTIAGPFAGVFLDRWPRRQVLAWANALRAVLLVVLTLIVLTTSATLPFYICALAAISANRFILAGLSAALPHTVSAGQLVVANAFSPTAGTMATAAGGVVSFVVHLVVRSGNWSTAGVLLSAACLYATAGLFAFAIPRTLLGPADSPGLPLRAALGAVLGDVASGARHVLERRSAGRALGAMAVSRFCFGVVTIMTLLLYRNYFNPAADPQRGLAGFAFAAVISGLGFGLGAVVTPFVARRVRLELWLGSCLLLSAVTGLVFLPLFRQVPLLIGAFLLGTAAQGQKVSTDTLVQRSVDDDFRGRVFVLYDMLYNGSFVLAAAVSAASLPVTGVSTGMVVAVCAAYALAGLWYLLGVRTGRTAVTLPQPIPADPPTTPAVR
ncbi:MAG TPA: MFS transporter [Actinocrinis sp.]|nr:MFS transporter [Actinocrinis sp.]